MISFKKINYDVILIVLTTIAAIALFLIGVWTPPQGVIDGSLLKAGGILLGFATILKLKPVRVKKGDFVIDTQNEKKDDTDTQ